METSPLVQGAALVESARILCVSLTHGEITVADARRLEPMIREAEGWLLGARRFLDPSAKFPQLSVELDDDGQHAEEDEEQKQGLDADTHDSP